MFLVIDIGNTNTVFAIYEQLKSGFLLAKSFRIYSDLKRTPDEYSLIINQSFKSNNYNLKNIDGVAIASVVPEILNNIQIYFRDNLELPIFQVEADKLDIEINIQNPNEAGQDRLINAFAVKKMKFDPAIIIDFGTATTFDVIGNGGAYLGGIISPGVNLSIDSLYKSTSRLPKISVKSPAGNNFKSSTKAHAFKTSPYLSSLNFKPNKIFSFTVPLNIQDSCIQSATLPFKVDLPPG